MARRWTTLSDEIIEHAEIARTYFRQTGYSVAEEKSDLGFPFTPALVCKRQQTTLLCEIGSKTALTRVDLWIGFAKSQGRDMRLALVMPESEILTADEEAKLRNAGIGLYRSRADGNFAEVLIPQDLAFSVALPPIEDCPRKIRMLLGKAYEQFGRGNWREGFEDACHALEDESRRYVKGGIQKGRITILAAKGPKNPTVAQINKMTLGALAKTVSQIQNQNLSDAILGKALDRINKDRIGVVHHRTRARTENRLRKNVGQHMWSILAALKEIVKT
ncbi:MAG TPA: hypothetical protein VHU84_05000 [Lacipirellulaceae bacterium]|jgi:hypothetical protein|nr:hypothetical protein [Lacipirellulaceae bacterium]